MIVWVVSGGMVSGLLTCTLYSFLLRVYSSVSIEYVKWGKWSRPWLTSRMALLFFRNVRPSIGPVSRFATMNVSLKFQSSISNWGLWSWWGFQCRRLRLGVWTGVVPVLWLVLGGHLEDFVVIGFGDAVDQCSWVDEGVQGQVLEVHWGE